MKSIKIKNLRSIKNSENIELSALNILLGQNSSGKSTFLRLFPLLKQSIEARTRGPILWYGDYVDFGDFNIAVSKGENEMSFEFEFQIPASKMQRRYYNPRFLYNLLEDTNFILTLTMKSGGENKTFISQLILSFFDQKTEISFDANGKIISYLINNEDFTNMMKNKVAILRNGIIPTLFVPLEENRLPKKDYDVLNELKKFLKQRLRANTSENKIENIIANSGIGSDKYFYENLLENSNKYPSTWGKIIKKWDLKSSDFIKYKNLIIVLKYQRLLTMVDDYLVTAISNFHYIKPLRATAERYYRRQDLAVATVDAQGSNLAMFIDNLTPKKRNEFQEWIKKTFGFYPVIKTVERHVSIRLIDAKTNNDFNITDKGFGFSQILPIITQLWSIIYESNINRQRFNVPIFLAIEQPELHLHPALQAKLIDSFIETIKLAKEKGVELKLILETHSQTIVNYIGHKIADNDFSEKEVSIVLFEFQENTNNSFVKQSNYNKQGFLENWPIGFFEPK